jgi:PST family polysaccharide transporter
MNKINTKKAVKATIWSAFGVYTNRFLSLGIAAVLSRLLTPEDFGTIAMITVISGFMSIFAEAGIGSVAVQFRDFVKRDHQTMFTLSLCLGLFLALLLAGFSSYVAAFFHNPDLKPVAIVMALAFPFSTLGIVPRGLLQRDMRFRAISIVSIVAALFAGLIGIGMAFTGWGYWSLVVQTLANSLISSCAFIWLARLAPVPRWDFRVIKKIFSYSGNLTLFSMINYWARNLDNLLIGRFLGSAPLGYYNRAYQLMMLPLSMLTGVITPVLHSVLAQRQNDIPAMYLGYLKVVKMIGLISIPGMTYAVIMSPELIRVVWGDQWDQTIPIFAILGLNGLFQPIMSTTGTVFLARNKADWLLKCGVVSTILLCSGILFGLPYGIIGVAIGYTIASFLWVMPLMYLVFVKLLEGRFCDFLLAVKKPLLFSIFLSPAVFYLTLFIRTTMSDIVTLLVTFTLSFLLYVLFLFKFENELFVTVVKRLPFAKKDLFDELG